MLHNFACISFGLNESPMIIWPISSIINTSGFTNMGRKHPTKLTPITPALVWRSSITTGQELMFPPPVSNGLFNLKLNGRAMILVTLISGTIIKLSSNLPWQINSQLNYSTRCHVSLTIVASCPGRVIVASIIRISSLH